MESLFGLKILKVDWSSFGRNSGPFAIKLAGALVKDQRVAFAALFF